MLAAARARRLPVLSWAPARVRALTRAHTPLAPASRRPRFSGERHYRTKAIGYVRSVDTVNKLWNETGPRYA